MNQIKASLSRCWFAPPPAQLVRNKLAELHTTVLMNVKVVNLGHCCILLASAIRGHHVSHLIRVYGGSGGTRTVPRVRARTRRVPAVCALKMNPDCIIF